MSARPSKSMRSTPRPDKPERLPYVRSMLDRNTMLIEMRGIITTTVLTQLMLNGMMPRSTAAVGVVIRFDRAVLAMDRSELEAVGRGVVRTLDTDVATAVVVPPVQADDMRAFAWLLAHFGVRFHVCIDFASARAWVQENVKLKVDQDEWNVRNGRPRRIKVATGTDPDDLARHRRSLEDIVARTQALIDDPVRLEQSLREVQAAMSRSKPATGGKP